MLSSVRGYIATITRGEYRKCSMLLIFHVKKFHVFNFRCLTEQ